MISDETVVRVTRYIKMHTSRNPLTGAFDTRNVHLGWSIGEVDGGTGLYIYGPPYQIYGSCESTPMMDSHVLYTEEFMPASTLPSTSAANPSDGTLHLSFPNI